MEVFTDLVTYKVKKNTAHRVVLIDQNNLLKGTTTLTSDSRGEIVVDLGMVALEDGDYDRWVSVEIREGVLPTSPVVLMDTVTRVRQYASTDTILAYMEGKVNPTQAVEYERIARHLIDSIIGTGFGFTRKTVTGIGNNTDSLVFHERIGKVFTVSENQQIIWDSNDLTDVYYTRGDSPYVLISLTFDMNNPPTFLDEQNRLEHTPTWPTRYSLPLFKYEYDYTIDAEWGWPVVPQDIQDAALMLISDIACGANRYANKYIRQWSAGGVTMGFSDQVFGGTGNLIVDNILDKYKMEAIRARML